MPYRDVLVSMDGAPAQTALAGYAAKLALGFDAAVLGAFTRSQALPPFISADVATFLSTPEAQRLFDAHEKALRQAAETARKDLETAALRCGVASEWAEVADAAALVAWARRADLLIVSGDKQARTDGLSPASLAMASGTPTVVVPTTVPQGEAKRILIAWNGSREAARALHAAWPILTNAEAVDVLIVGRGRIGPDHLLQRHLERHGVRANLIEHDAEDALASEILRREAQDRRADLLVMGLYGRTRLSELVLGGVSRELLADPPAPLFVVH